MSTKKKPAPAAVKRARTIDPAIPSADTVRQITEVARLRKIIDDLHGVIKMNASEEAGYRVDGTELRLANSVAKQVARQREWVIGEVLLRIAGQLLSANELTRDDRDGIADELLALSDLAADGISAEDVANGDFTGGSNGAGSF
jgi:hypothetical protein